MMAKHSGATNRPLLDVRHLNVDYLAANGTVHAVTDVSFTLRRGEILGLAGESGSGKSTLAYAITRLLRPPALITSGEIVYYPRVHPADTDKDGSRILFTSLPSSNGKAKQFPQQAGEAHSAEAEFAIDILQASPSQLRALRWNDLAIVFQSAMNALNPVMNLETQITDVLKAHHPDLSASARRQRAVELLRLVSIAPDRLHSYPHELSGGMRQRAIIAIALALSPEIIIMDEPTTALDVVVQRDILAQIVALRNEFGFSIIFITHDLSLLLELADTIAIMYAGRIVEKANGQELYRQPRHPYSHGLLNSFPALHGPRRRMTGIPGSPPDLRAVPSGCAFHPRCPLAFAACSADLPALQHVTTTNSEQSVACHLYNPAFRPEPPTPAEMAAHYEALAEGSSV
jgi:peptide/nickel transport system ATP-binding protein